MIEDQAREDIAFIRQVVAEGRNRATARSPEMLYGELRSRSGISGPTPSCEVGRRSVPDGCGR